MIAVVWHKQIGREALLYTFTKLLSTSGQKNLWAKKKNNFRIHYLIPFDLYTEQHLNPYGWSTKYYSTCLLIGHSMPRPCAVPSQVRNQNWAAQR
jgi:hypothetical protein